MNFKKLTPIEISAIIIIVVILLLILFSRPAVYKIRPVPKIGQSEMSDHSDEKEK
jgi:hypothetical protein